MMRRHYSGVAGLAVVLVGLAGCSTKQRSGSEIGSRGTDQQRYVEGLDGIGGVDRLGVLAEREAIKGSEPAKELANRIMVGQLVELRAGTTAYRRAHRSLDDVLDEVSGRLGAVERKEVPLHPQIGKGYVRARAAMLNGDAASAAAMFEKLSEASPESSEILIGLGDALMAAGDRAGGTRAYVRAIDMGDRTVRAMVYGAMGSVDDAEKVIELGAMIWSDEETTDRGGRLLGGVMLGQALIQEGWYAAGAEVMEAAMGMLDAASVRDVRYRRELVQLYTKRGEQMASIGDAWMLLDRPGRALEMYDRAGALVGAGVGVGTGHEGREPRELMARRVAAMLMEGHSALGALTLLDWIDARPGNDSVEFQRLVGIVGEHPLIGTMLFDALGERLRDSSRTGSERRAILGMMLTMTQTAEEGAALLVGSDAGVVSAVACARVLDRYEDRGAMIEGVVGMVEESASIGAVVVPAMIRLDGDAVGLLDALETLEEPAEAVALVRVLIGLDLQRVDLVDELDGIEVGQDWSGASTAWVIAMGRAAALDQRWAVSEALFEECDRRAIGMNGAERFFYVDSLATANRADDGVAIARRWAQVEGARSSDWLVLARAGRMAGEMELVLDALGRAMELDAYNEAIYEQLITIHGSGGAFADGEALGKVSRELVGRLPDSALVKLVRAHELAGAGSQDKGNKGQGLLVQSERLLINAHEQHPWREIGTDLLLSIWATAYSRGDEGALERGMEWIENRVEMMPGSVELAGAKARLMVLGDDVAGAERYLEGMYERMPSRQMGRLHEGLIRSDVDRRDEADALALERLDGLKSIGDGLERLERAVGLGRLGAYSADDFVPDAGVWAYGEGQLLQVVRMLGGIAQTGVDAESADLVLELVERVRGRGGDIGGEIGSSGIDPAVSLGLIELVVGPGGGGFSMDWYEGLVRGQFGTDRESESVTVAIQALMRSRSNSDAVELVARLCLKEDGTLDGEVIGDLVSLMGQIGTVEDMKGVVERFVGAGVMIGARDAAVEALGVLSEESMADADDVDGVIGDFVYGAAVVASFYDRDEVARGMYRLVLEYAPEHAWANNDLGYGMVEDWIDGVGDADVLVEAEGMLELAHRSAPGTASITDSLAWVRYALGVMVDEVDDEGVVVRQGAVGLLREALSLDKGTNNATIYDHLGDALWMSGELESAMQAWLDAESRLRERLVEMGDGENVNQRVVGLVREELESIRLKIADGEQGQRPGVAPTVHDLTVPVLQVDTGIDEIDPTK